MFTIKQKKVILAYLFIINKWAIKKDGEPRGV